ADHRAGKQDRVVLECYYSRRSPMRLQPTRYGFTSPLLAALLFVPSVDAAAQTSARTSDGKPNLQGIWQVLNTAAWDIQDHSARLGVPAGQGIVLGNDIPYTPAA